MLPSQHVQGKKLRDLLVPTETGLPNESCFAALSLTPHLDQGKQPMKLQIPAVATVGAASEERSS